MARVNLVGNFYPPSETLRGRFLAALEFSPMETTPDSIDRESQQLSGFSHRNFHLQPRCETDASLVIYQVARADDGVSHCSIQAVVGLFGWLRAKLPRGGRTN
jgi:hypothetical protein